MGLCDEKCISVPNLIFYFLVLSLLARYQSFPSTSAELVLHKNTFL